MAKRYGHLTQEELIARLRQDDSIGEGVRDNTDQIVRRLRGEITQDSPLQFSSTPTPLETGVGGGLPIQQPQAPPSSPAPMAGAQTPGDPVEQRMRKMVEDESNRSPVMSWMNRFGDALGGRQPRDPYQATKDYAGYKQRQQHLDTESGNLRLQQEKAQDARMSSGLDALPKLQKIVGTIPEGPDRDNAVKDLSTYMRRFFMDASKTPDDKALVNSDKLMSHILNNAGSQDDLLAAFPFLEKEDKRSLALIDEPEKRITAAKSLADQRIQAHLGTARTKIAEFTLPQSNPVGMKDVLTKVNLTRPERLSIDWWLDNQKDEDARNSMLDRLNIQPIAASGKDRSEILKSVSTALAGDKDFAQFATSKGLSVEQALKSLPLATLQPYIDKARKQIQGEAINLKREEARATGYANKEVIMNTPMDVSMKGERTYRNRQSGELFDTAQSWEQYNQSGGNKSFAKFDMNQEKAYQSILESKSLMVPWLEAAGKLVTKPGQNFTQAVDSWVKTSLGKENVGVELAALKGSILRFAGAMQGSRVQLSDQDRKSVESLFAGIFDSQQTAKQRFTVLRTIMENMEAVQLGRLSSGELSTKIKQMTDGLGGVTIKGKTRVK